MLRNFVVAVRNGFELDPKKGRFRAYLQTMTRNACYDQLKSRGRTVPLESSPEPATDEGDRIERQEQLLACWQHLQESGQIRRRSRPTP